MPVTKSVKKSLRQSIRNQKRNRVLKTRLKRIVKKFLTETNEKNLGAVYSCLDKIGKKGFFHKKKISRLKAKYARKMKLGDVKKKVVKKM